MPCDGLHSFHNRCISKWLYCKPQCPQCRWTASTPASLRGGIANANAYFTTPSPRAGLNKSMCSLRDAGWCVGQKHVDQSLVRETAAPLALACVRTPADLGRCH